MMPPISGFAATAVQPTTPSGLEAPPRSEPLPKSPNAPLSAHITHVASCRPVSRIDSTTGAHYANDAHHNTLLLAKSNDEWLEEFLGNQIAALAGLRTPRFELVAPGGEHFPALRSKLEFATQNHACMIFDFLPGVNLKEVDTNSCYMLDIEDTFNQLGRAVVADIVIGNLDRFPIFNSDTHGNAGNILFELDQDRLVFIDNVAMKHVEVDSAPVKNYLPTTQDTADDYFNRITDWLTPRFPHLGKTPLARAAFGKGLQEAWNALTAHRQDVTTLLRSARQQLNERLGDVGLRLDQTQRRMSAHEPTVSEADIDTARANLRTRKKRVADLLPQIDNATSVFWPVIVKALRGQYVSAAQLSPFIGNEAFDAAWKDRSSAQHRLDQLMQQLTLSQDIGRAENLANRQARELEDIREGLERISPETRPPLANTLLGLIEQKLFLLTQQSKLTSLDQNFDDFLTKQGPPAPPASQQTPALRNPK